SPCKLREARAREAVRERDETEEKLQKAWAKKQRKEAQLQRQVELEEKRVERQRLKEMREVERAENAAERARKRKALQVLSLSNKRQKRAGAAHAGVQAGDELSATPAKVTSRGRNVNLPQKYRYVRRARTCYAATRNAFRILDGLLCPTFEPDDDKYTILELKSPISVAGQTSEEAQKALGNCATVNRNVRDYNAEARTLRAKDESKYNNWITRDAELQNTIMSSIMPTLIPYVRVCDSANAMYTVLKELNTSSDYANASAAWVTFISLRADTCKTVREYISKYREALGELSNNGIKLHWKQPNNVDKSDAASELMIIHFLNGLSSVLPDWVEARNNDIRKGDKQREEQRVLARRPRNQPAATPIVKPTDNTITQALPRNSIPKTVKGMCNHCQREHSGPNEACWKLHPELVPDWIKKSRAANNPARTNVTKVDNNASPDTLFGSHTFSSTAAMVSPTVIKKAVHNINYKKRFCYNTAANRHVFNDRSKFVSLVRTADHNIHGSTGSTAAAGVGTVNLIVVKSDGETERINLNDVLYCPDFATNVISQAPFKRKGAWYHSGKNKLYTSTDNELAYLPEIDGIPNFLVINDSSEAPAALCYASHYAYRSSADEPTVSRPADDWHHIYGHANMNILKRTAKAVKGMVITTGKLSDCPLCGLSKSQQVISRRPQDVPTELLGMIHVDIVGPIATPGRDGEIYWMLLTAGKTGQQWIETSENRATLGVKLINWCKRMKALSLKIITIRVDNARELLNNRTRAYFDDEGIAVEASPPYEPTRNGRAERANGITENRIRAALIAAGLPACFWPMAAHYIIRLRSLSVTSAPNGDITPLEAWNRALNYPNPIPNVAKMHAFGHTGYVHIPAQKRVKGDNAISSASGDILGTSAQLTGFQDLTKCQLLNLNIPGWTIDLDGRAKNFVDLDGDVTKPIPTWLNGFTFHCEKPQ
ncbi:rve domain containing protein, partial [Pyrenophora tritici-repentis]